MNKQTLRDRLWLWGMKVNVLQETSERYATAFGKSTLTVEQAIQRTGIRNVFLGGGLPIAQETLNAIPSARRFITKDSIQRRSPAGAGGAEGKISLDYERALSLLDVSKELARGDTRIEGCLLDDFSTAGIDAGVKPEHLVRLQFANATQPPHLPLSAAVYSMSLDRPELPSLLRHFALIELALWHVDQVDTIAPALDRLADMTGGKPVVLCLYLYDFGNHRFISGDLMQRHLDLAEELLMGERISGALVCGTCMMDLDWESNRCLRAWLERVGDRTIAGA